MIESDVQVRAAGGLLRRETDGVTEFCIVHRPRYEDWTIPKGKLEPGESHRQAALREIEEETGFSCSVGAKLPGTRYLDTQGRPKSVRYWLMEPMSGAFQPNAEVDALRWLPSAEALAILTYPHDRAVIEAAVGLDAPLFLVRHAKAGSRSNWEEDDRLRPLSKSGRKQAEAISGELVPQGVTRIISSPYVRCVQTVRPLALAVGVPVEVRARFAEGEPTERAWTWIARLPGPTAICSHGDLIPALIERAGRAGAELPAERECRKGSVWRLERRAGAVVSGSYRLPS